jgi:hypothetical protein
MSGRTPPSRTVRYPDRGVAFVIAGALIGWHFWDSRGEVLKPDGGPVATVMDFGQSFPLNPPPPG